MLMAVDRVAQKPDTRITVLQMIEFGEILNWTIMGPNQPVA